MCVHTAIVPSFMHTVPPSGYHTKFNDDKQQKLPDKKRLAVNDRDWFLICK